MAPGGTQLTPAKLFKRAKYQILLPILSYLPLTLGYKLINIIGRNYFYRFEKDWVQSYQQGLQLAFPQQSKQTTADWAKKYFEMMAREELDVYHLKNINPQNYQCWVRFNFEQLQQDPSPKLFLIGHYNRTILLSAMGLAGQKSGVITTGIENNPHLDAFTKSYLTNKMNQAMKNMGGHWITTEQSLRNIFRELEQTKALVVAIDVPGNQPYPFLNGQIHLVNTINRIAQKAQASCYYLKIQNRADSSFALDVTAIKMEDSHHPMTQATSVLEKEVISQPWAWWQWNALQHIWKKHD